MTAEAYAAGILLSDRDEAAVRQTSLLDRLSSGDRDRVRQHGRSLSFGRREVIFRQGDPHDGIVIIETGLVRSYYRAPRAGRSRWRSG